jgi:transcriptional regulator with XRE-family HTH domain
MAGNLGRNLRQLRKEREMTQEEVGHRSGVHPTEVSRIESGKRDPQVSTVERLAKALGVPASDLLR